MVNDWSFNFLDWGVQRGGLAGKECNCNFFFNGVNGNE